MDHVKITPDALSVDEITKLVQDPSCGAISIFIGTTRDNFEGQTVVRLEYESYQEMAEKEIYKLCKRAREKWSLQHIGVYHRLGLVPVTEASVILAVSSVHRRESLDAVSFLIDELKASVPIWKKEVYDDGSGHWKQNKECVWTKKDNGVDDNLNQEENLKNTERKLEPPIKKMKVEEGETVEYYGKGTCGDDSVTKNSMKMKKEALPDCEGDSPLLDPNYVQIVASKNELGRRIKAFQQRKREELDVINVQEFCAVSGSATSQNSCARTSAVVLRSKDSNSHLKLTRVVNEWGPQTMSTTIKQDGTTSSRVSSREGSVEKVNSSAKNIVNTTSTSSKMESKEQETLPPGLDERLHNLESHLKIHPGSPVPCDLYSRLKAVEDRVLYLEGISPEYFREKKVKLLEAPCKKEELKAVEDDLSLDDLDIRIHDLKMKLKERQIRHAF